MGCPGMDWDFGMGGTRLGGDVVPTNDDRGGALVEGVLVRRPHQILVSSPDVSVDCGGCRV